LKPFEFILKRLRFSRRYSVLLYEDWLLSGEIWRASAGLAASRHRRRGRLGLACDSVMSDFYFQNWFLEWLFSHRHTSSTGTIGTSKKL
jgi:hypothetical protein